MTDIDCLGFIDAQLRETFLDFSNSTTTQRGWNDVVQMVAMAGESVNVDCDLDVWIRRASRRMTDGDFAVGFLSVLEFSGNRLLSASLSRSGDDVIRVISMTCQAIGVDGDLDVWIGCATCCVTNRDSLVCSNHFLANIRSDLLRTPTRWCRDDVICVVAVTVEATHINGYFHEGVRRTTGCVADGDAAIVLLFSDFGSLLDGLASATAGWGRNDVTLVIGMARKTVSVNRDLDVRVRLAARRVTNRDLLFCFNFLGNYFCFPSCIFYST